MKPKAEGSLKNKFGEMNFRNNGTHSRCHLYFILSYEYNLVNSKAISVVKLFIKTNGRMKRPLLINPNPIPLINEQRMNIVSEYDYIFTILLLRVCPLELATMVYIPTGSFDRFTCSFCCPASRTVSYICAPRMS